MTAAACYWTCTACLTLGDTDKTAEQHTRATGHATITSASADTLARMRAQIAGAA